MAIARPIRAVAAVAALTLLAGGACGDDDDGDTTAGGATTTEADTTTSEPEATTSSTTAPPPTSPAADDDLPGEPFELTPAPGRTLAVVGVRHDDVLNVRRLPGTDSDIVATLEPLAADFVATGRGRTLSRSIWWEVTTSGGVVGWVGSSFTATIGPTGDATSAVVEELGEIPQAETMTALGTLVAETLRSDPDVPSEIVLTVAPTVGDLGEVTYDLVGLGDDAVYGLRIHVFGQPAEDGEGFSLKSAEVTDLCVSVRGSGAPGELCV